MTYSKNKYLYVWLIIWLAAIGCQTRFSFGSNGRDSGTIEPNNNSVVRSEIPSVLIHKKGPFKSTGMVVWVDGCHMYGNLNDSLEYIKKWTFLDNKGRKTADYYFDRSVLIAERQFDTLGNPISYWSRALDW